MRCKPATIRPGLNSKILRIIRRNELGSVGQRLYLHILLRDVFLHL